MRLANMAVAPQEDVPSTRYLKHDSLLKRTSVLPLQPVYSAASLSDAALHELRTRCSRVTARKPTSEQTTCDRKASEAWDLRARGLKPANEELQSVIPCAFRFDE